MPPLAQRIIDNLATNQFTSDRERILTPDHKLYRKLATTAKKTGIEQLPLPGYRFRKHQHMAFKGTTPYRLKSGAIGEATHYPIVQVNNAPSFMEMKPLVTHYNRP